MIEDRLTRMKTAAERKLAQALKQLETVKPDDRRYSALLLSRRQAEETLDRLRALQEADR